MFNKILSLMKEGSMRKTAVILLIALFVVFCSVGAYAQQITKVDKEKFDKLTPEQKKVFVERAKEARDTALESVKDYNKVIEKSEDLKESLARGAVAVTKGAIKEGAVGALKETVKWGVSEKIKDYAEKEKEKKQGN
jgi:TRAP-type C4-dicarboxylate transport system substrate-binding protein